MGNQAIGNLSATITANAQQLIDEFRRAQDAMDKNTEAITKGADKIEKGALKIGLGMIGAQSAARLLVKEIRSVIENIDSIPGVSPATIDSIHQMKFALEGSNSVLKQGIATIAAWGAEIGLGLGYGLGALAYGTDAAAEGFKRMSDEAEAFANKDYNKKFAELQTTFDRLSVGTKGKMAALLNEDAAALENFAKTGSVDLNELSSAMLKNLDAQMKLQGGATTSDRQEASLQAGRDRIEAQRSLNELQKEYASLLRSDATALDKEYLATLNTTDAIKFLTREKRILDQQQKELFANSTMQEIEQDPEKLEKSIGLIRKQTEVRHELSAALRKNDEWIRKIGESFDDEINTAILTGKKFKALLADLARDIEKIILKQFITQPLGNLVTGALGGLFGTGGVSPSQSSISTFGGLFAAGGDPPVGRASIVGEQGPELFVPREAGTVYPASTTRGLLSGGSGTRSADTYYIDATGADPAAIARLESTIRSLNGSIERRSIAAVINAKRRGGGMATALA